MAVTRLALRPGTSARVAGAGRVLHLRAIGLAGATAAVLWVAVDTLLRHGQLVAVLEAGRAELAAPALAVLVAVVLVVERVRPAERRPARSRGHLQDACYLVLHATTVIPLMTLLSVGFATLVAGHAGWIEIRATERWPAWLVLAVTIVAMDGANWLAHYGDHRLGLLWRFHALHHSQEELSVLTSFRAHPIMHTTGFLLASVPVVALMGGRPMVPVLITAYVCVGTLQHANVRWAFGPIGWIVVSPAYHRLHHDVTDTRGMNLGVVLTVWDVLAGRARFPSPADPPCATGLAGRPVPVEQAEVRAHPLRTGARQLAGPFVGRRQIDVTTVQDQGTR